MNKKQEELKEQTKTLFKVVDKLENRISTLEQVIGKLKIFMLFPVAIEIEGKDLEYGLS